MPFKDRYDYDHKDPTRGLSLHDIMEQYRTFDVFAPQEAFPIKSAWLLDPKINHLAKIVLIVMHAFSSENHTITISTRQLQCYTHTSRDVTQKAINSLVSNGYVARSAYRNGNRPIYIMLDPVPDDILPKPKRKKTIKPPKFQRKSTKKINSTKTKNTKETASTTQHKEQHQQKQA